MIGMDSPLAGIGRVINLLETPVAELTGTDSGRKLPSAMALPACNSRRRLMPAGTGIRVFLINLTAGRDRRYERP